MHHSSVVGNRVLSSVMYTIVLCTTLCTSCIWWSPVKVNYGGFDGSYAGAYGGSPYIGASIDDCGYGWNLLVLQF
jgi:hypothetical protein